MLRSFLFVTMATLTALTCSAMESFEHEAAGWRAENGTCTVSEARWKLGQHSLRWNFAPEGRLSRPLDDTLTHTLEHPAGGVKLWICCDQPLPGKIEVQAGAWSFPIHLGFTGWRAVWIVFSQDGERVTPPVNGLRFTAPAVAGTVYLDALELGAVPWSRQGDAQTPYSNPARANGRYWMTSQDWAAVHPPPVPTTLDAGALQALREIEQRYETWMFGNDTDPRDAAKLRRAGSEQVIASATKAFAALGLTRRGDIVLGPGAFCGIDSLKPHLAADIFQTTALGLAFAARLQNSAQAAQNLLDLLDYAHDQGWAAGSLMGSGYGGQLRIAAYVHAVYIMRDFLRQQNRLERELETLAYHLNLGEIYHPPETPGASADDLRTRLLFRVLYALMQDDPAQAIRDMRCLVRWADSALQTVRGKAGTIKPDGTVFHHGTAYASAYGNNALLMSSFVYWLLHGTPFSLSAESAANLGRSLLALRFMSGTYTVPMGVSGRWPFSGDSLVEIAPAYAYLADALDAPELGAAFARLWRPEIPEFQGFLHSCGARIFWANSPGAMPLLLDAAERWEAESTPSGHRSFPYAAMSVHRRRQWVASVRGWSKYVWNYESSAAQNRYGRYSSYGMIQIFSRGTPVNRTQSGFREEGWDWLRPPGATVIRVPLETLHTSTVPQRQYTEDPFVGGVELQGTHGLWAMRFRDPFYCPSFRFRKSVVFVDETILCLGSGINNTDAIHDTETVLYQVAAEELPTPFPLSDTQTITHLLDPVGTGYYFPEPTTVSRLHEQRTSMHNSARRQTEGKVASAWISHGKAPSDAAYAYAIRPDTNAEALRAYAEAPDFTILRQDSRAHVVHFQEKTLTAYALFEPNNDLPAGPLRAAERACLIMTRQEGNTLYLSVCDPDLAASFPELSGTAADQISRPLRLFLEPRWIPTGKPPAATTPQHTVLEVTPGDGRSSHIVLQQIPR